MTFLPQRLVSSNSDRAGRQRFDSASSIFDRGLLVRRGVSFGGPVYFTHVRDGATPEEIFASAAADNGGFLVKAYHPKLNAWEIVAIKIGNELLVKGDPALVAQAALSHLSKADQQAVLDASSRSVGGLHFFFGKDGVPVVAGKDGSILFPNAEELRVRGASDTLYVSVVTNNFDPQNIGDLDSHYSGNPSGGLALSGNVQELLSNGKLQMDELQKAHGGMRSEKLLLDTNSVLVLKVNSGELMAFSEQVKQQKERQQQSRGDDAIYGTADVLAGCSTNEFAAPQFASDRFTCLGLTFPTIDGRQVQLPMDGSRELVPFLFVRVFDGRLMDQIQIFRCETMERSLNSLDAGVPSGSSAAPVSGSRSVSWNTANPMESTKKPGMEKTNPGSKFSTPSRSDSCSDFNPDFLPRGPKGRRTKGDRDARTRNPPAIGSPSIIAPSTSPLSSPATKSHTSSDFAKAIKRGNHQKPAPFRSRSAGFRLPLAESRSAKPSQKPRRERSRFPAGGLAVRSDRSGYLKQHLKKMSGVPAAPWKKSRKKPPVDLANQLPLSNSAKVSKNNLPKNQITKNSIQKNKNSHENVSQWADRARKRDIDRPSSSSARPAVPFATTAKSSQIPSARHQPPPKKSRVMRNAVADRHARIRKPQARFVNGLLGLYGFGKTKSRRRIKFSP